jgi:hypothetical protein
MPEISSAVRTAAVSWNWVRDASSSLPWRCVLQRASSRPGCWRHQVVIAQADQLQHSVAGEHGKVDGLAKAEGGGESS